MRPAVGYPASPDHTEKDALWRVREGKARTGIWLTESKAMVPAAAVSELYLAHPEAHDFAVGKVNRNQLAYYGERKRMPLPVVEKWLGQNRAYEPE